MGVFFRNFLVVDSTDPFEVGSLERAACSRLDICADLADYIGRVCCHLILDLGSALILRAQCLLVLILPARTLARRSRYKSNCGEVILLGHLIENLSVGVDLAKSFRTVQECSIGNEVRGGWLALFAVDGLGYVEGWKLDVLGNAFGESAVVQVGVLLEAREQFQLASIAKVKNGFCKLPSVCYLNGQGFFIRNHLQTSR